MTKKLRVRKVDNTEEIIDADQLTADEVVEEEIDDPTESQEIIEPQDTDGVKVEDVEEGKGDDPNNSEIVGLSDPQNTDENSSVDLQSDEPEFVTLWHKLESGTLILAHRSYDIINHEVKVLVEDFQDCIHHGLEQKE